MAMCPCLFASVSVRINVVFDVGASFDQSYTVFYGNSGIYKDKGTYSLERFLKLRT